MAQLDMTAFDYALKTQYAPERVQNLTLDDQPALALIPKFEKFKGKNHVFAAKYTDVRSASHDFATAQSLKSSSQGKNFTLTRKKDYAVASIDNETIEASEGDEGAFLQALEDEMDSAIHALKRRMGIAMFGDGSAKIGTIATSGVSTVTVTLADTEDISNFEVGQEIVCATATSATPINGGASVGISAVDRDAGTLTMDEDVSALGTPWTDTYVLFQKGDYVTASDKNRMMGFAGWIPDTAPSTTETWCNCDRSTDPTRLAGIRLNLSGYTLPEGLVRLHTAICRQGGGRDLMAFMSFSRLEELINVMGSKAIPVEVKSSHANIGFPGFKVIGPKGTVTCVADVNCPADHLYMIQENMWKLMSLGPAPKILKYKGSGLQVETTNDGVEIRVGYYAQTKCMAPVRNGVGTNFGS